MSNLIVPFSSSNDIVGLDGNPLYIEVTSNMNLKPCPFCGGEAEVKEDKRLNMFYVTCPDCKVETDVYHNMEKPIEVWNRRVYK